MIIKLKDDVETVVDLTKVSFLKKNSSYEGCFENPQFVVSPFVFYLAVGFEKLELQYSSYEKETNDFTIKGMKKAGEKFLSDYKLIEEYLLGKWL